MQKKKKFLRLIMILWWVAILVIVTMKRRTNLSTDGWIIGKIAETKLQNAFPNLWTGSRPKIPIGEPVLAVLWKTTPNKYQLPSHLSLFNTIYSRRNNLVSLPTSACILSRHHIWKLLHKSWNFCFAKTLASEQKMGNLEAKVRAGLSCSNWRLVICGVIIGT